MVSKAESIKVKEKRSPRVILGVLFVLVFFLGWFLGKQDSSFSKFGYTPKLLGRGSGSENADFGQFWKAWELIEKNYDGELDYKKMVEGAIRGMTNSLEDPYTSYMNSEEANELEGDLSGTISGIGAEIGIKNNKLIVISPIDDSPAKKAGIMPGDNIAFINNEPTDNMSVNEAVSKIRGEAGTKVKLKVVRNGNLRDFEITRETFTVKSVEYEVKNKNVGYITVARFDDKTSSDLNKALKDLKNKNIKKIILDLRDNPGGYLDESVKVASEFVKTGVIVSESKGKDGRIDRKKYNATGSGEMTDEDIKIVVLINKGSASASEIVAGALKDNKRATLVGETTYGKGSVQQLENLFGGAQMRITVAHWFTPSGKNIGKEGIKPDQEIELTEEDYNNDKDPQLDKALDLLR